MKYTLMFLPILLLTACGGTTVGNPQITLQSSPYTAPALRFDPAARLLPDFALTAVTDLKFCITKLKLQGADGSYASQNGSNSIEAILGLIDHSNASGTVTWGTVTVPTALSLKQIDIELHVDAQNCSGANYSISYNGTTLTKDLEFHFEFATAADITGGDLVKLGLTNIVTALEQAKQAGKFTNELIGEYLTATLKGTASE